MRKIFTIFLAVLITVGVFLPYLASAQVPQKMNY
jgi:hypothetical protein